MKKVIISTFHVILVPISTCCKSHFTCTCHIAIKSVHVHTLIIKFLLVTALIFSMLNYGLLQDLMQKKKSDNNIFVQLAEHVLKYCVS